MDEAKGGQDGLHRAVLGQRLGIKIMLMKGWSDDRAGKVPVLHMTDLDSFSIWSSEHHQE